MKVAPEVISMLNDRLAAEHAGIVQYVTHQGMCDNWGLDKLTQYILARAKDEMRHAGMILDRILFLEGVPELINVGKVEIAKEVAEIFTFDREQELEAIAGYTEGIDVAIQYKDFGTRKLLEQILEEEEGHLNAIEGNMSQIEMMGIENYLPVQIEG